MTESPRHKNSIIRVKSLLRELGATIRENDDSHGEHGYMFEPIYSEKAGRPVQYIADILAIMPSGAAIDFEINLNYHNKAARDHYRAAQLAKWFITTIWLTPALVDMIGTPEELQLEIDFAMGKRTPKLVV